MLNQISLAFFDILLIDASINEENLTLGLTKSPHISKLLFFFVCVCVIKAGRVLVLPQRELNRYIIPWLHIPAAPEAAK